MNCIDCKKSVLDNGGTQLDGCVHYLCTECTIEFVKQTNSKGIRCSATAQVYKCSGRIKHEDLQAMIPEDIYEEYLKRTEAAGDQDPDNGQNAQGGRHRTTVNDLNISLEEKLTGWAHKASVIDELVRLDGLTNDEALRRLDNLPIIETRGKIKCTLCEDKIIPAGDGIVLKDCEHMFCKDCIKAHIKKTDKAEVVCPYVDRDYKCGEPLKTSEMRALVDQLEYERHVVDLSLTEAANQMHNVFHCLTPGCKWFCVTEGFIGTVVCEICQARNCIPCHAVHEGICPRINQMFVGEPEDDVDPEEIENNINAILNNLDQMFNIPVGVLNEQGENIDDQPEYIGRQPEADELPEIQDEQPVVVGDHPEVVRLHPENANVVEQPEIVGEQPEIVGEQPEIVGEQPKIVGEQPEVVGEQPELVGEEPELVGKQPDIVGEQPENIGQQSEVDLEPEIVAEQPEIIKEPDNVGPQPEAVKQSEIVGEQPEIVKDLDIVDEQVEITNEQPAVANEQLEIAAEQPDVANEQPEVANEQPAVANDPPEIAAEQPDITNAKTEVDDEGDEILKEWVDIADDPEIVDDRPKMIREEPEITNHKEEVVDDRPKIVRDQPVTKEDSTQYGMKAEAE